MLQSKSNLLQKYSNLQIGYFLLIILAFSLPFNKKLFPYIMAFILLDWIISFKSRSTLITVFKNKYLLLFSALFITYLIGVLYSTNLNYAASDIELKLSLLIFPIVLYDTINYNFSRLKNIFIAFIVGCILSCIICLAHAFFVYPIKKDSIVFFYTELSYFHHPGYFSMYLCFAIACLLFYAFLSSVSIPLKQRLFCVVIITFLSLFIILLSSKTGILISLLIFFISFLFYFIKHKRIFPLIGSIIGVSVFYFLVLKYDSNPTAIRLSQPKEMMKENTKTIEKTTTESTRVRFLIWASSIDILKQHFLFGVGTGDVKDVLLEKYKENGMIGAYNEKLNAHNQFIQTFIALGLPGFLFLLFSFIFPFIQAFRTRNFIYLSLLLILFISFLTESMLETIAGVMFYSFFNSILMINIYRKELSLK